MHRRLLAVFVLFSLAVLGAGPSLAAPASAGPAKVAPAENPVDINKAAATELAKVPGIGPSLAKRIVEFREKNGAFAKVEDLVKVQGIGEKSLQKFAPYLTVTKSK